MLFFTEIKEFIRSDWNYEVRVFTLWPANKLTISANSCLVVKLVQGGFVVFHT